jgi:2-polyprenyl-3-methyl-5-hydroxy-6-metoxy-1,4-benzoquinol methylase
LKNIVLDDAQRERNKVEGLFRQKVDPYGFSRQAERLRFECAEQMIDAAAAGRRLPKVLEIGCAEGMFTERLASRCGSLLAVDISEIALARARQRCSGADIQFRRWDIRTDAMADTYDLVVAVGVLEYLHGRMAFRQARHKLIQGLRVGGYLLLGSTVQDEDIENSWMARWFLRGGHINAFFARHPSVRAVDSRTDQCALPFTHTLLQRAQ